MKIENKKLIIDISEIDQSSYEALRDFAEQYDYTEIGQLVKEWIYQTEWDAAAWYIGEDL